MSLLLTKHEHSWWVRPFVTTVMPECISPDSVIALLYALSMDLRLTVHYFEFHTPLQVSSQCSHYVPSADSAAPRLRSLTFSWDPGLLMTFLRFVSLSEQTAVDYLESAFGVKDIWHARTHTVSAQLPCDVTHREDIKKRLHAREWRRELARPLQKEVGLVWNIDVLWDLRGAVHETYKLLPPVAMFTVCWGVMLFLFKAMSESKQN